MLSRQASSGDCETDEIEEIQRLISMKHASDQRYAAAGNRAPVATTFLTVVQAHIVTCPEVLVVLLKFSQRYLQRHSGTANVSPAPQGAGRTCRQASRPTMPRAYSALLFRYPWNRDDAYVSSTHHDSNRKPWQSPQALPAICGACKSRAKTESSQLIIACIRSAAEYSAWLDRAMQRRVA